MKEMSISRQRARELVAAYDHSLEQQILRRGSNLSCQDEDLSKQVEELLSDGDAQETHCLGLDSLRVMEESLKAAAASAPTTASSGRIQARGGLLGLAKAFEVLEQAALNLYLGPWREEYKVVKMYSGIFTHCIKPVLSMPQIEKLFGMLGYQPSMSHHQQLSLQSARVSSASLNDLLCLSCAFFLARCECRLLLMALGKNFGDVQWQLSLVRERQRGHTVQVALDNTKKTLEVSQPLMEPFDVELEVDLYTDDQLTGRQKQAVVNDDESPRSMTWVTQSSAPPSAIKTHSNGVTTLSSSSSSVSNREDVCISKLNCHLTPLLESNTTRSSSASVKQERRHREESRFDIADSQSCSLHVEAMGQSGAAANQICACLHSYNLCLKRCIDCNAVHGSTCAFLKQSCMENHCVVSLDNTTEKMKEPDAVSPQGGSLRASGMSVSPTISNSSAAMSSLNLCSDPCLTVPTPMAYHDCCNLAQPDPQVLCISCGVFHSALCRNIEICKAQHTIKLLGECSCGRECSRNPLVLCRYCGKEYCRDCWYRNPLQCTCGQTFDQSSSV